MAFATKPKLKIADKKRRAKHHSHSRHYLKTYWPYLPMLGIIAAGWEFNRQWPASLVSLSGQSPQTRIQALTGDQNTWALSLIVAIAAVAAGVFLFQHWFRVQRVLNRGEEFAVKHPWFDILLVAIATAGIVLTRTARF